MAYCSNCGNEIGANEKFCSVCGTQVISGEVKATQEEIIKPVQTSSEDIKKGKYTKEGKKIIDSGPRPAGYAQNIKSKKVKKKKKGGCLRFFLRTVLVLFILMIVGVVIIWNLPDDSTDNLETSTTTVDQVKTENTNKNKKNPEIRIDPNDKNIADKYSYGVGVRPDQYKALEFYKKAAKQGDLNAMLRLSDYYEQGIFVKKDHKKALKILKKAADAGSLEAEWQLEFLESQK